MSVVRNYIDGYEYVQFELNCEKDLNQAQTYLARAFTAPNAWTELQNLAKQHGKATAQFTLARAYHKGQFDNVATPPKPSNNGTHVFAHATTHFHGDELLARAAYRSAHSQ